MDLWFVKFDPEKVTLLTGNTVVIDDVGKQRISVKAADALREWLRPLELHRLKAQQERSCRDSSQQTAKLHKGHRIGLMTTVTSAFGKKNTWSKMVADAVRSEVDGNVSVFYLDNNEASKVRTMLAREAFNFGRSEVQFLSRSRTSNVIHSIDDSGSPVKGGICCTRVTESAL